MTSGEKRKFEDMNSRLRALQLIQNTAGRKSELQDICDKVRLYRNIDKQLIKLYGHDAEVNMKDGKSEIQMFNDGLLKASAKV